jgi:hypothetical protein
MGIVGNVGFRALNVMQATGGVLNARDNVVDGKYGAAILDGVGVLGNVALMTRACFAAGTPMLTPTGNKPIDQFKVGDLILSRDENNPEGPLEAKVVEETFANTARIMVVRVGGREIKTTAEHPFWLHGKGWLAARELQVGDVLSSHNGQEMAVEIVEDTDEYETVYNCRVQDYSTYFVGGEDWGFSVWAHNSCDGLHHYVPMFMGSQAPRGSSLLTWFRQIGHISIHRAMNRFLQPLGMAHSRVNRTVDIVTNFSREERLRALVSFYRQYQGGAHYQGFIREVRAILRAGLFS